MSLEFKYALVFHALRVEAGSWRMVQSVARSMVSMTTDFGTESGLTAVPETRVSAMFPFWAKEPLQDESDDIQPPQPALSLEHAIQAPGIMHQVSTMLNYVSWSMSFYETWREGCSHVGSFLCDRASKDLMRAMLFDNST
eukprot:11107434-Lingulodinium_polyedra.AAC.1